MSQTEKYSQEEKQMELDEQTGGNTKGNDFNYVSPGATPYGLQDY